MSTPKSSKSRAFPRIILIRRSDIPRWEELISSIPYNHCAIRFNSTSSDEWITYSIRLKTQELLALRLAGYNIKKLRNK